MYYKPSVTLGCYYTCQFQSSGLSKVRQPLNLFQQHGYFKDGHNLHNCQSLYLKSTSGKCVLEILHCEPRGRHIQQS